MRSKKKLKINGIECTNLGDVNAFELGNVIQLSPIGIEIGNLFKLVDQSKSKC